VIAHLNKLTVAEITSTGKGYPTEVPIGNKGNLPPSLHGSPDDKRPDLVGQTEFGADAWTLLSRVGFQALTIHSDICGAASMAAPFRGFRNVARGFPGGTGRSKPRSTFTHAYFCRSFHNFPRIIVRLNQSYSAKGLLMKQAFRPGLPRVRQLTADEATVLVWRNDSAARVVTGGRCGHAAIMLRSDKLPELLKYDLVADQQKLKQLRDQYADSATEAALLDNDIKDAEAKLKNMGAAGGAARMDLLKKMRPGTRRPSTTIPAPVVPRKARRLSFALRHRCNTEVMDTNMIRFSLRTSVSDK